MRSSKAWPTRVSIGAVYRANGARTVWRVERLLGDGRHVVLVSDQEPDCRKTISAWALADARYFVPAAGGPAD